MTAIRILFRRARTLLWTSLSILIIFTAVLVGVGKLLMPYSDRFQPRLEAWLTEEFGRPVELGGFDGEWRAFGPRLTLKQMRLLPHELTDGAGGSEVAINSAALDINPLNFLIPGKPLYNFRVIGAAFTLSRDSEGQFTLSGLGVSRRYSGQQRSGLADLARVGEVILEDSSLVYTDEVHGVGIELASISGRLQMDGDRFATEVSAELFDGRSKLVFGELEGTLLLKLDNDNRLEAARWQASGHDLMLAAFQSKVPANPFLPLTGWLNAELWGEWTAESGHEVRGAADATDALLVNDYQDLSLEHVNMRFNWNYLRKGRWRLDVSDFLYDDGEESWVAPSIALSRDMEDDLGLWISADQLPLGVPLKLTRDIMSVYGTEWPASLPQSVDGTVSGLDLMLTREWRLKYARGLVSDASIGHWDRWPGMTGLDAEVMLENRSGTIALQSPDLSLDWPRMFREPLNFAMAGCELELVWGQAWQLGFRDCRLENEQLALHGSTRISKNEGKPAVDVNVAVERADIGQLDNYWPQGVMKENVISWLRQGLVSGRLENGRVQIHGDMDDWPFREGVGTFEAVADVRTVELNYVPEWPRARGVNVTTRFFGPSMEISGQVDDLAGVRVEEVFARIDDMMRPLLQIDYATASDLPGFLGFIQASPLEEQIQTDLSRFEFTGPTRTSGELVFPLGSVPGESRVSGVAWIEQGGFHDPVADIRIDDIVGEVSYDRTGFRGEDLAAAYRGHPARIVIGADAESDEKFKAEMTGNFDVDDVIPGFLLESYSALAQINGSTEWQVVLTVGEDIPGHGGSPVLTVRSGLEGVRLDLPAPLEKPAEESWPLVLHYPLSDDDRLLDIELLDRVSLHFALSGQDDAPQSAVVRIGGGVPAELQAGMVRIEGHSDSLDLDGWIEVIIDDARDGKGLGGLSLERSQVSTGSLLFLDRLFSDVTMEINLQGSDLMAAFHGEGIEGKVNYATGITGIRTLNAEFERLALDDPISSGMDTETNPAELPALHLYARSFRYAGVELGETRIEAYPDGNGFHFEKVDAESDQLTIQASGDWSIEGDAHRSDFRITMSSESLGDFLSTMDISSAVQGGQTVVQFNAWWPGSPAAFALSRLNGEVEFSVLQGNIADASPGTGRLLGLLSVSSLPKRLSLDFRDVFDSGFSFDEASGTFTMENGQARTEDFLMKSSAAQISISGSTDLVDQQYDQLLTVKPGVGNTLPVLGAIAGGPLGVAAGLALQGLLHEQLGDATQVQYTITGSWAEPVFEPVIGERTDGS